MQRPVELAPIPTGRYRVERSLAATSRASTALARDAVTGRHVLLTTFALAESSANLSARLAHETPLLLTIRHPNVRRVVDAGSFNGFPCLVTEHHPGRTLRELLGADNRLPVEDVVSTSLELLAGLGAIHAAGFLHLRLSPSAVHLGDDGVARLTGFGVTALIDDQTAIDGEDRLAEARFLAPEQLDGGDVSEATDLYSAGAVIYRMATGRVPFARSNVALLRFDHLHTPPPRASEELGATGDLPAGFDEAIQQALAKSPADRYASAEEMALALARFKSVARYIALRPNPAAAVTIRPSTAEPSPRQRTAARQPRTAPVRRWAWPVVISAVMILLLTVTVRESLSGGGQRPRGEAVAGVSLDPASPSAGVTEPTATARVIRPTGTPTPETPAARATSTRTPRPTRTPKIDRPTRTPRPARTPTPDE